jgi:L-rhamnose-H+ transport protein
VVWSVLGMLLGPVALAVCSVPHIYEVYRCIGTGVLLLTLIIGAIAGTSGFLYALAVQAIGLGLSTALNVGSSMAVALLPLLMLHGATIGRWSGRLTISGIVATIGGILLCTRGGTLRERESLTTVNRRAPRQGGLLFVKGVAFAIVAGVISTGMNLGLAFPSRFLEVFRKFGSSEFGAAVGFLAPYLVGGFVSNFLYAIYLVHGHHTVGRFRGPGSVRCALWSVVMAILFVLGVSSYAASVAVLGTFGAIVAWGIFAAASILTSAVWDVVQKEWSGRAARAMAGGVLVLLAAIIILALAQYVYELDKLAR